MAQIKSTKGIDRRKFIKTSAATGASIILAPNILRAGKSFGIDNVNVALLGAGAQGQVLMNACLKIPGVRFKAVCDIWKEYNQKRVYRLLGKYGHNLNAYENYKLANSISSREEGYTMYSQEQEDAADAIIEKALSWSG